MQNLCRFLPSFQSKLGSGLQAFLTGKDLDQFMKLTACLCIVRVNFNTHFIVAQSCECCRDASSESRQTLFNLSPFCFVADAKLLRNLRPCSKGQQSNQGAFLLPLENRKQILAFFLTNCDILFNGKRIPNADKRGLHNESVVYSPRNVIYILTLLTFTKTLNKQFGTSLYLKGDITAILRIFFTVHVLLQYIGIYCEAESPEALHQLGEKNVKISERETDKNRALLLFFLKSLFCQRTVSMWS